MFYSRSEDKDINTALRVCVNDWVSVGGESGDSKLDNACAWEVALYKLPYNNMKV